MNEVERALGFRVVGVVGDRGQAQTLDESGNITSVSPAGYRELTMYDMLQSMSIINIQMSTALAASNSALAQLRIENAQLTALQPVQPDGS